MLVKPGNTKDALAKYDEALKYTPNWKQLKESREAVAKQKTGFRRSEAVVRDRPLRVYFVEKLDDSAAVLARLRAQ